MKGPSPKEPSWGERIRRARLERGLAVLELAKSAGVDRVTIYRIESGESHPRGATVRKILLALEKAPKLPEI